MREKEIIKVSIVGIIANVFLAAFKAVIGTLTNSIAITLDAVNNLSDVLSSIITIIGTRIAGRKPDKKHPLGHGRVEYLSAGLIAIIVLYAGITSLVEAVKKIINPSEPEYTNVALIIVAVAVVVKLLLGSYVKSKGKKLNSDSLIASGEDARLDAVISASTVVAALIYIFWDVSLESYLAALISLVIIKAGYEMISETLSQIIGQRTDKAVIENLKATVMEFEDVFGVYDVVLHNYGPDTLIGSLHIEVLDTYTAGELDELERKIMKAAYDKNHVILAGISVYARNSKDDRAKMDFEKVRHLVMSHEYVLQMHGFYINYEEKIMNFDIILDFDSPDRNEEYLHILSDVNEAFPDFAIGITLDLDVSD
ncbi:Cadmium, cobalt and zinc/H(+)-K(+) antiporter [[Eubacterium] infirmum]|nr:Cadmium, cobalt and zinc/H(+)-K(+) antiporter [[Eubacterium] infirmum]